MKPSMHPPLYVFVATASFCLGSTLLTPRSESFAQRDSVSSESADAIDSFEPVSAQSAVESVTPVEAASETRSALSAATECAVKRTAVATTDEKPQPSPEPGGPILRTSAGDVQIFPADNPWNQDISRLPVHSKSDAWLAAIGLNRGLHPDFGTVWNGAPNGIPYVVVSSDQPKVPVAFRYHEESDAGPYPIPPNVRIEGGSNAPHDSDRHIILIDPKRKLLYELFQAIPDPVRGWQAGSGAIFDLSRNHHRTRGWTSADAAGLPIFPGLVRYEEVAAGAIRHALRFTVERTQRAYIFPARHFASRSADSKLPPMGLRVRLRQDFDLSGFPRTARIILQCLKTYGMLLADNGSNWFISGAPNPRWSDDDLATIKRVKGRDLECVMTGPLVR